MTKEVINVGLYGGKGIFGGREEPLVASVISCDKHRDCSYFQQGQCWRVRGLGGTCKFGSVSNIKGYTSRAKKYRQFEREWSSHEQYGKLKRPPRKLGVIDGKVVLPYHHVNVEQVGELVKIKEPLLFAGNDISYVDYDRFTADVIYKICMFRPQAMMGGEISSYRKETVPLFLAHLEEVLPEKYKEFTDKYPEFAEKIDHVGRKAYLKTINPSTVYYKGSNLNETWEWDGEILTYVEGHVSSFFITRDYDVEEIKLRPSDKSTIVISDNNQVTKDTVFID